MFLVPTAAPFAFDAFFFGKFNIKTTEAIFEVGFVAFSASFSVVYEKLWNSVRTYSDFANLAASRCFSVFVICFCCCRVPKTSADEYDWTAHLKLA